MDQPQIGALVTVTTGGPELDGIVFDVPSRSKVVVALVDRSRGPVLRTIDRGALSEREQEGPADRALWLLIRRTPPPPHGASRSGGGVGRPDAGHGRGAMHRTTSK